MFRGSGNANSATTIYLVKINNMKEIVKEKLHVITYDGWGDSIYSRQIIRELSKTKEIYLQTSLPDIYRDLPVKFIPNKSIYRTQAKHITSDHITYSELPPDIPNVKLFYNEDLQTSTVVSLLLKKAGLPLDTKLEWDLPDFKEELSRCNLNIPTDKPLAIVRPATQRKEWHVSTRNPDPHYINWCSFMLMEWGYHVISVADLEKNKEWLVNNQDVCAHQKFYSGEIPMLALFELMKEAKIVVGGSGFIVPASVSAGTNLFLISGGRLGYDGISKIIHPTMNLSKIQWAMPSNPCRCTLNHHDCNKYIPDLDSRFVEFMRQVNHNQTLS